MKKLLIASAMLFIASCQNNDTGNSQGKQLAQTYCGSCHIVPDPALLDKTSWERYILPRMGVFLGIIEHDSLNGVLTSNPTERHLAEQAGYFPKTPVLQQDEWEQLKAYYISNAPAQPTPPQKKEIKKDLTRFTVRVPDYKLSPPSVTMVHFDTANKAIFIGDANTQMIAVLSADMQFLQGAKVGEGVVAMEETPSAYLLTVMGSFSPTDVPGGYILSLPRASGGKTFKLIDSLRRPVHAAYAQLDGDNAMDVVTCEFSKWTGVLAWWHNNGDGTYTKNVLRNRPGAIKAYVSDMDNNGLQDIIALFGQGDEGIFIYYNQGNGQFHEQPALRFPPSYGSTYFQLYDFNQDGHHDIIYTAGDNADFPPILKHYHGVYIFMNDGHNKFSQQHFFPLNGAYAAIPNDYDADGDVDIAAISFFPDYKNQPEESFVYLENDGQYKFSAHTFADPTMGRWIVMQSADYDADGDKDLILGSLAFEVVPPNGLVDKWVQNGIGFIVLQNTTH